MKFRTYKITTLAILLALASISFLLENLLPPILPFLPYIKIGISNIFVLLAIIWFSLLDAFMIVLAKNMITAFVSGWFAFLINISGSLFACIVMYLLYITLFPKISLLSISFVGAILSNWVRTTLVVLLLHAPSFYLYLPIITIFSLLSGICVGCIVAFIIQGLPQNLQKTFCHL